MRCASTSGRWAQCCCSPARARQVIAKRIDRGQLVVMKALTRSPIVIREIIVVGEAKEIKPELEKFGKVFVYDTDLKPVP